MSRSGIVGTYVAGPKSQDAKVVGNNISGGAWGIYVDRHPRGLPSSETKSTTTARACSSSDIFSQPVGGFEVKGNTVENNTRSCRAAKFEREFSGIGIALLGAREHGGYGQPPLGQRPFRPHSRLWRDRGSVSSYFDGTAKPRNNSVIGNHFGRNKPDIFYDKSGSGNRFVGNLCNSSVPSSLCN